MKFLTVLSLSLLVSSLITNSVLVADSTPTPAPTQPVPLIFQQAPDKSSQVLAEQKELRECLAAKKKEDNEIKKILGEGAAACRDMGESVSTSLGDPEIMAESIKNCAKKVQTCGTNNQLTGVINQASRKRCDMLAKDQRKKQLDEDIKQGKKDVEERAKELADLQQQQNEATSQQTKLELELQQRSTEIQAAMSAKRAEISAQKAQLSNSATSEKSQAEAQIDGLKTQADNIRTTGRTQALAAYDSAVRAIRAACEDEARGELAKYDEQRLQIKVAKKDIYASINDLLNAGGVEYAIVDREAYALQWFSYCMNKSSTKKALADAESARNIALQETTSQIRALAAQVTALSNTANSAEAGAISGGQAADNTLAVFLNEQGQGLANLAKQFDQSRADSANIQKLLRDKYAVAETFSRDLQNKLQRETAEFMSLGGGTDIKTDSQIDAERDRIKDNRDKIQKSVAQAEALDLLDDTAKGMDCNIHEKSIAEIKAEIQESNDRMSALAIKRRSEEEAKKGINFDKLVPTTSPNLLICNLVKTEPECKNNVCHCMAKEIEDPKASTTRTPTQEPAVPSSLGRATDADTN